MLGQTKLVETGHWKAGHGSAEGYSKKIHLLDQMVDADDWDEVASFVAPKPSNSYQKAVGVAWKKAVEQLGAKLGKSPEEIAAALNGAVAKPAVATEQDSKPVIESQAEKLPPKPPKEGPEYFSTAETNNWTKKGGKLGTAPGGTYEDADGKKYYLKKHGNPQQAVGEVLAAGLYGLAGSPTLDYRALKENSSIVGTVTPWEDATKADWDDPKTRQAAAAWFAVHAWLNNRDAIGAGSENPMDNQRWVGGVLTTLDTGGALMFGGLGGEKDFGNGASEWDTLRDPKKNPSCAKVFGQMTAEELYASAQMLKGITDEKIGELVDKFAAGGQLPVSAAELKATLIARRDAILAKAEKLNPKKKPVVEAPKPEPKPEPEKPVASGSLSNSDIEQALKAAGIVGAIQYAHDAMKAGDPIAYFESVMNGELATESLKSKMAITIDLLKSKKHAAAPSGAGASLDPSEIKAELMAAGVSDFMATQIMKTPDPKGKMEQMVKDSAISDSSKAKIGKALDAINTTIALNSAKQPEAKPEAKPEASAPDVSKVDPKNLDSVLKAAGFTESEMVEAWEQYGAVTEGLDEGDTLAPDGFLSVVSDNMYEDPSFSPELIAKYEKAALLLSEEKKQNPMGLPVEPNVEDNWTGNKEIDDALKGADFTPDELMSVIAMHQDAYYAGQPAHEFLAAAAEVVADDEPALAAKLTKASQIAGNQAMSLQMGEPVETLQNEPSPAPQVEKISTGYKPSPKQHNYAYTPEQETTAEKAWSEAGGTVNESAKGWIHAALASGNPQGYFDNFAKVMDEISPEGQKGAVGQAQAVAAKMSQLDLPKENYEALPVKPQHLAAAVKLSGGVPSAIEIAKAIASNDPGKSYLNGPEIDQVLKDGFPKVKPAVVSKLLKESGNLSTEDQAWIHTYAAAHDGDYFGALADVAMKTTNGKKEDAAWSVMQSLYSNPDSHETEPASSPNPAPAQESTGVETVPMPAALPQPPTVSWGMSAVSMQAKNKMAQLYNAAANGGLEALEKVKLAFHGNSYGKVIHAYKAKLVESLGAGAVATVKHAKILKPQDVVADVMKSDDENLLSSPEAYISPTYSQTPEAAKVGEQVADKMVAAGFVKNGYFVNEIAKAADPHAKFAELMAKAPAGYKTSFQKASNEIAGIVPAPTASVAKPKPKHLTADTLPVSPTFVSSNAANVAANQKAIQDIVNIASGSAGVPPEGVIVAIQKLPASASPKVEQYKKDVIEAMSLTPEKAKAKKAASTSGDSETDKVSYGKSVLDEIASVKPLKVEALKESHLPKAVAVLKHIGAKIAKYLVLGSPKYDPGLPARLHTGSAKEAELAKTTQKAFESMPPKVQAKMKAYTGGWYATVNDNARDGKMSAEEKQAGREYLKASHELPVGTHIARGLGLTNPEQLLSAQGKVITEPGFFSGSINGVGAFGGNVRWEVTAGPGARAMLIKTIASSSLSHENEVVYPPNQRFFVHKVIKQGGRYTVFATALPTTDDQCCP